MIMNTVSKEEKEKLRNQCREVWDSARQTIAGNESVLDTQSFITVIGVSIIMVKIFEFQQIPETLKICTLIFFIASIILCLVTPLWLIRCRRVIQGKIEEIIYNHYQKDDGTFYSATDIYAIHKKYAGHRLPFFKIHTLEFLRLFCIILCILCIAISLAFVYT